MTTSTPPAWNFLHECSVPMAMDSDYYKMCGFCHEPCRNHTEELLSMHSRKLPDSDAFRAQNDSPDPTGTDVWPLERAVSTTASSTFCVDSSHETASFPQGENSGDVKVDLCPECAALHVFRRNGQLPERETADVEETPLEDHAKVAAKMADKRSINGDNMKHKDRVRMKFGKTDLDHLAQVIYTEFHGHDALIIDGLPPWTLYKKWRDDPVVEEFRSAAEAAILDFPDTW